MVIAQNFFGKESLFSGITFPLKIQLRENITSAVKRVSFVHPSLERKLFVADPAYWGKHFKVSHAS